MESTEVNPALWQRENWCEKIVYEMVREVEQNDMMHLAVMFSTGLELDWQDYTGKSQDTRHEPCGRFQGGLHVHNDALLNVGGAM